MIRKIIAKEVLEHMLGLRFLLSLVFTVSLFETVRE